MNLRTCLCTCLYGNSMQDSNQKQPKRNQNEPKINQAWTQNRPKIGPKSSQSRSKIGPKSVQNRPKTGYGADFAFEPLFGPILVPFWLQLGAILGAKLRPCWAKNRFLEGLEKHQKTNMIFNTLRGPLGTDFGTIFGPKIDQKSVQKRSQERASKKAKIFKKPLVFQCFLGFGGVGNRSKINQNRILKRS